MQPVEWDANAMFHLFRRKKTPPVVRLCSVCQEPAPYGYSDQAEASPDDIQPLCLKCLDRQLHIDYHAFSGRAVVVEPASGPPVYVFQVASIWNEHFENSRIAKDVLSMLERMDTQCRGCGNSARFLWVRSDGLSDRNFEVVLDRGLSDTLLQTNPPPLPLCAACCVARISATLEARNISYREVCSPKGDEAGFVVPMGY
jgi:hypothetical protein